MENLKNQLTTTLRNAPSGVHFVVYGPKYKNGEYLNDLKCIVYGVEKKLPISQLNENQIIPKKINIDGIEYTTDVIERKKLKPNTCYEESDSRIQFLRSRVRPLSGGLEISPQQSFVQNQNGSFSYWVGTLGFLAIDNNDNRLVGVTNAHVMLKDPFVNSEKNPNGETSSISDQMTYTGFGTYPNRILQFGSSTGIVNFSTDGIGTPKRYVPYSSTTPNYVDGAIFSINQNAVNLFSASQALDGTFAMPFCTTNEIDSILSNQYQIYSVGRTTGPKGPNCPMVVHYYGSAFVDFERQGVTVETEWEDLIWYKFIDDSPDPSLQGDSGSGVIVNINGTYKIAGLLFAGNGYESAASRIDRVAQELNISAWNGSTVNYTPINPTISKIYRPITDTRKSITYNGKTYYLAGTERTTTPITNV
jgi:hypothetical protein